MDKQRALVTSLKAGVAAHLGNKDWARILVASTGKAITPRVNQPVNHAEQVREVYLVIDCSNSMSRKDKMQQARRGALLFAREARNKGYLVGLIGFASEAAHLLEPTESLEGIRQVLGQMKAGKGSTNMAHAIQVAREHLAREHGERVCVLVTDGQPDNDRATLSEAEQAKAIGVEIMTIGTDAADRAFLEQIASRHELSAKVASDELEQSMVAMAKLLPMLPAPKRIGTPTLRLPQL